VPLHLGLLGSHLTAVPTGEAEPPHLIRARQQHHRPLASSGVRLIRPVRKPSLPFGCCWVGVKRAEIVCSPISPSTSYVDYVPYISISIDESFQGQQQSPSPASVCCLASPYGGNPATRVPLAYHFAPPANHGTRHRDLETPCLFTDRKAYRQVPCDQNRMAWKQDSLQLHRGEKSFEWRFKQQLSRTHAWDTTE
jgi:hypothetical protein